jgi:hypothetical protein
MSDARDAFDRWWHWATKEVTSFETIPAEIHNPVMALPEEARRHREWVNAAVRRWSMRNHD